MVASELMILTNYCYTNCVYSTVKFAIVYQNITKIQVAIYYWCIKLNTKQNLNPKIICYDDRDVECVCVVN